MLAVSSKEQKGKSMKKVIYCLIASLLIPTFVFGCIDREVARRDWVEHGVAENCLFDFNCDHFNEMEK